MNKLLLLPLIFLSVTACVSVNLNNNSVREKDLLHHNFVLTEVDGEAIALDKNKAFRIEFGEKMHINASFCNEIQG